MVKGARTFDEVSLMVRNKRSVPYEDYFGEMDLSETQRQERIDLAYVLHDAFLPPIVLLFTMSLYGGIVWGRVLDLIESGYNDALRAIGGLDDYMTQHIQTFTYDFQDSTVASPDDPYMYSMDRVMFMAENEAETACEHFDFLEAVLSGKTQKQWVDMHDNRERKTHREVGGTVKPILEPFLVGDSFMLYPKDSETYGADPKEYVNCRCTVRYS